MDSIEELGARLRQVEDQLAIYQVLSAYVYAVDGLNAEVVGDCFTADAVYSVSDLGAYRGRKGIVGIVNDPEHGHIARSQVGVAHTSPLPHVVIEGDRAVATCHMLVFLRGEDGEFGVYRLSASRIELGRQTDGKWRITGRHHEPMDGSPAGPALLARLRDRLP